MAESSTDLDTDEFLFLDKEFLFMLEPKPQSDFRNALKEMNDEIVEQRKLKESTKSRYKVLKEKAREVAKTNDALEQKIAALKEELGAHERSLEEMDSQKAKDLYRHECQLYYTISNIKWDLDCPENEVAGVIGGKSNSTFHFDTTKYSKSFITENLWSLIEDSVQSRS